MIILTLKLVIIHFLGLLFLYVRAVNHPEYPSVLQALEIEDPVVANCLIDQKNIESILLIKARFMHNSRKTEFGAYWKHSKIKNCHYILGV